MTQSQSTRDLILALTQDGRVTARDVADAAGITTESARATLRRMVARGEIREYPPAKRHLAVEYARREQA